MLAGERRCYGVDENGSGSNLYTMVVNVAGPPEPITTTLVAP